MSEMIVNVATNKLSDNLGGMEAENSSVGGHGGSRISKSQ
jgi:hypothetical protein